MAGNICLSLSLPQIATALVDQADWKARRGPVSMTTPAVSIVASVKSSGSNVSRRSHCSVPISSAVSGAVTSMLKHCSVAMDVTPPPIRGLHSTFQLNLSRCGQTSLCLPV